MPATARGVAWTVLRDVERGPVTASDRLAREDVTALEPRERAFAYELVLGSLRRRGAIDHALAPLLDRPLSQVDPDLRALLRLGAHQLLHLRVPARAAVHEAVTSSRAVRPRGAGFVNAVLRRLAREGPRAFPDASVDPLGWLISEGSLPEWVARRWLTRLGPATAVARARDALQEPPRVFRPNPRIPDALERARQAGLDPLPLVLPGTFLARGGRPADLHGAGVIYIQDEQAQAIAHLAAGPGRTLDACAAPGGKATLIADLIAPTGHAVAAEASPRRLRTLARLVSRWGSENLSLLGADALAPPFAAASFDQVLLDAPCSGLGTLGHHPDLRWRVRPRDVARHAARQGRLLAALAPLVRPGGRLVYATCSTEPEENEAVVADFLSRAASFSGEPLPAWAHPLGTAARGYFAALLRRS